jgi:drug/metabolite transporter (DMT)-like permease
VFFWGVITMLPACIWNMYHNESQLCALGQATGTPVAGWSLLLQPTVFGTLFFLGLIASFGCFLLWNIVLRRIGIIAAGNYLYFNPVTSLIAAYLVLSERITWLAILGCLLTIVGVYLCNHGSTKH